MKSRGIGEHEVLEVPQRDIISFCKEERAQAIVSAILALVCTTPRICGSRERRSETCGSGTVERCPFIRVIVGIINGKTRTLKSGEENERREIFRECFINQSSTSF